MTPNHTGLTVGEREALITLGHILDSCGLPLDAIDTDRMTTNQRLFWASYVVAPQAVLRGEAPSRRPVAAMIGE